MSSSQTTGGIVRLGDLDDYISPGLACIKPVPPASAAAASAASATKVSLTGSCFMVVVYCRVRSLGREGLAEGESVDAAEAGSRGWCTWLVAVPRPKLCFLLQFQFSLDEARNSPRACLSPPYLVAVL